MNECTSGVGHLDGHADALKRYGAHPNSACPGLLRKPLDVAIRQLLALYRPGSRQGDNKQNNDATCTHIAGRFDGRGGAPVLYCVHHPVEEVHGFHKSH